MMERIGRYVVHKAALTSGYARVLFCHDPDLQVPVAVKLFSPKAGDDGLMSPAQWLTRFQAEARALAAFDHPHIVAVKTLEHAGDGRPFFVMPYQGAHLPFEIGKDTWQPGYPERDRPRRLPLFRVVTLLRQLASALSALHRRGMVHRCVKPSNVLLTARENGSVKLADFSMVKVAERNPPLPDLWPGGFEYCAPEQRENASAVGPQADVYSLGVLAYRLATGAVPDPWAPVPAAADAMPARLAELVRAATDHDPANRPAHAGAVLDALKDVPVDRPARPRVQVVAVRRPAPPVAALAE